MPSSSARLYALPSIAAESIDPSLPIQDKQTVNQQPDHRINALLDFNLSIAEYESVFNQCTLAKMEWVRSLEFGRRLKRLNLTDQDLSVLRSMVANVLSDTKVYILPPDKFDELVRVLEHIDISNSSGPQSPIDESGQVNTEAFFAGSTYSVAALRNSILFKADQAGKVSQHVISHELGHAGFSALREFKKGQPDEPEFSRLPKLKLDCPNPGYIGSWIETDTRVRAMLSDLSGFFDPTRESFSRRHLLILKFKRMVGKLNRDTVDLLEHYADEDVITLANTAPAI